MTLLLLGALFLSTTFRPIASEFSLEICEPIKDSYGLVSPPLPNNFEARGDHVDMTDKYAAYQEMYFDHSNSKAKLMYLLKGIERHFLFDYEAHQVLQYNVYHPGVDMKSDPLSQDCVATNLDESPERFIFGYLDEYTDRPKMYDAHQAMHFGGNYRYAYNGTERPSERGLLVDKYVGCIYDQEMDASVQINYTFTSGAVFTSGGTMSEDVTGMEDGVLRVPVQAKYFGSVYDEEARDYQLFNKTENYFWFQGEPDFRMDTFKLPPYTYCEGYRGRYAGMAFPTAFSTRLQTTKLSRDILGEVTAQEVTSFEQVNYYKEKSLARRDFSPDPNLDTEIKSKFLNYDPVKTIYDFNTGILYVTHRPTGKCYMRPISQGDFFETSRDSIYVEMGTPEEVFHLQLDDMEYKGTDFARDIECDVWIGKSQESKATIVKETYVATNGWHEEVDEILEYNVPVKQTIINQGEVNSDGDQTESITTTHFLKFKAAPPPLFRFDVSNCLETTLHRDFAIMLTVSEGVKKTIFDFKMLFLETAQYYISGVAQTVTPLRVQRLELRQVTTSTQLQFTLVGKPQLKTKIPISSPGPNLDMAISNLQTIIDTNQFSIQFHPPKSKEAILVTALKGSLYVKTGSGDLEAPRQNEDEVGGQLSWVENYGSPVVQYDDSKEEKEKGMSTGNLLLLGFSMLFIGVGIGIAVMYLYFRTVKEKRMEDRITLTPTASTSMEATDAEAARDTLQ